MIISRDPAFIFVAVPKTGSTSVENMLQPYCDRQLAAAFGKHALAIKLREDLPEAIWNQSFRFAFVRNPYDWMYSWYRFRSRAALRAPTHPAHDRYTGDISFDQFVHTFSDKELMLRQSDFLSDHGGWGEPLVDFVGRYETLQRDYEIVCDRLGLIAAQLPLTNESAGAARGELPMSSDSRRIINEYFRPDFELFGYPVL